MPGVYILNDPATQYLKIGRATRIEDRFANLRTANPRLVLLEWVETSYDSALESYIHNRLASFRREGEFFEVDIDTVKREITAAISLLSERPTNEALSEVISIRDVTPSRDPMDEEVYLLSKILDIRSELEKLIVQYDLGLFSEGKDVSGIKGFFLEMLINKDKKEQFSQNSLQASANFNFEKAVHYVF